MYLGRRADAGFAGMLPPNDFQHFHAALGACRRGIILQQFGQDCLDFLGILAVALPQAELDEHFLRPMAKFTDDAFLSAAANFLRFAALT